MEPSELAHIADADDPDDELICLPTRPEPDVEDESASRLVKSSSTVLSSLSCTVRQPDCSLAMPIDLGVIDSDAERKARKRKA
eukprot:scaffold151163_cov33-Tisochrysis_lutea.AAC.4